MDSKILYVKDGMKFTKIEDKNYNLQFSIENKNIQLANIVDFSLIKLLYDLNSDIYEHVTLQQINDNEAYATILIKHLFEDLGLPQNYSSLHIKKIVEPQKIIFRSKSILLDRPPNIPSDAKLMDIKENIGICEILTPHKIHFSFTVLFEDFIVPPFAEKMLGVILNKIFKRVKQFIENIIIN